MTECLFNTTVPLTVRSNPGGFSSNFMGVGGAIPPAMSSTFPFYTTNVTPVQFQDDSGRRVNSVVFEIYLQSIIANKKVLQLRISDVTDPFFMWQLDLTEEEFYHLRADQNLLVDFANFPYRMIELLQRCLEFSMVDPSAAPFFAQLTVNPTEGSATLAFIERTTFRQVTQLALKLKSVENEVIKRKLAELLKNYRDQISLLQSQIPTSSTSSTSMKGGPISSVKVSSSPSNNNLNNPNKNGSIFSSALVREKDEACAHLNQLYEVTKEAKVRIEDENGELKREVEILRGQFEDSQNEVAKANEIITKLQEEVRALKTKLKSSSAIADDQMNAAEQLRTSNKRLQGELSEVAEKAHAAKIQADTLERDNRALRTQIDQLERAIQQRDAIIAHHQRQANVKDLDRAIRDLDEAFTSTGGISSEELPSDSTVKGNTGKAEEDSGYIGSRIFDQTF